MPHTSRRNKPPRPPQHTQKLRHQDSDDGWTQVVRGARGLSLQDNNTTSGGGRPQNIEGLFERLTGAQVRQYIAEFCSGEGDAEVLWARYRPRPREGVIDAVQVEKEVARLRGMWKDEREGQCRQKLRNLLDKEIPEDTKRKIAKVVCIGLGSLSSGSRDSMRHAAWQSVVLEELAEYFRLFNDNKEFKIIGQDPMFNDVDKEFLSTRNVSVVDDPAAFTHVDSSAIVFAPHFPVAAWPKEMRLGAAAIVVSNDVDHSLTVVPSPAELQRIFHREKSENLEAEITDFDAQKDMHKYLVEHESFRFPILSQDENALSTMRVYWRRSSEDDKIDS